MKNYVEIKRALGYVRALLDKSLPKNMYYHNIKHTLDVYRSAIKYGRLEGLPKKDIELLAIAGIFHDTGYIERYDKNEPIGARIARKYMTAKKFDKEEIAKVSSTILATQMPQRPKNLMQRIICDSDLDHLGRSDLILRGILLKKELRAKKRLQLSDDEWNRIQIKFITGHKYFTRSARKIRNNGQKRNVAKLKRMLLKR